MRPLHLSRRNVPGLGWQLRPGGRRTEKGRLFGSLCLHLVALTSCFLGDQRWAWRDWPHVQPTPAQGRLAMRHCFGPNIQLTGLPLQPQATQDPHEVERLKHGGLLLGGENPLRTGHWAMPGARALSTGE